MNNWWTQLNSKVKNCDFFFFCLWKRQNTKLAATLGLRPFGLSSATIRDEQDLNTENNNVNDSEETAAVEREIEESKRFFSRFPPVAHHNMVQYSHLGKIIQHLMAVFKNCTLVTSSVIALCLINLSSVNMTQNTQKLLQILLCWCLSLHKLKIHLKYICRCIQIPIFGLLYKNV